MSVKLRFIGVIDLLSGGGMGEPGFPIPLRTGCTLAFLGAGAWGNRVSPRPSPRAYIHVRPHARGAQRPMNMAWERGRPARHRPMFTSAVHAAAPHPDGMNIISWEGEALPNPPRGRGLGARASGPRPLRDGETRFPHPPPPRGYVHVSRPCGCAAPRRDEHNFLGGRSPPKPSHRVGGWGNPVSSPPCSSSLCSRETVIRMAPNAVMTMPWERGRPARIAAPRAR